MKKLLAIAMLVSLGTIQANNIRPVSASVVTTAIDDDTKIPVKLNALPKDAIQYMKENYPVKQIQEVSKVSADSNVKYEVEVKIEGKTQLVQFDKKGELVNEGIVK